MILGADVYGDIMKPNIIRYSPTTPVAHLSIFGWLVIGPVRTSAAVSAACHTTQSKGSDHSLQELLTKFWLQEEAPNQTDVQLSEEEQQCEEHFKATHSRDSSGRYTVRLPLKRSPTSLGDSYRTAHRCLARILRRLDRDDEYEQLYNKFMTEYLQLGHMVRIQEPTLGCDTGGLAGGMTLAHGASASGGLRVSFGRPSRRSSTRVPSYYLPHHGVLRPDSTTTKLRVVFNGSSASSTGYSLNDLMHIGPNLTLNIFDLLIWIRRRKHLFATDITKMYRQIKVHPDDWDLQRILWIDDDRKEAHFHLTTVTYGTNSAPFLAVRTLLQLAEDDGHLYPLAVESIKNGRYVDDIFGGADSVDQLIEIALQLKQLCHAGGFPLAKWHSTARTLLEAVSSDHSSNSTISFDDCDAKILGIKWSSRQDTFNFSTISAMLLFLQNSRNASCSQK